MRWFISLFLLLMLTVSAGAEDKPVSYHRDIRPIFVSNCNACHKPEKLKGVRKILNRCAAASIF